MIVDNLDISCKALLVQHFFTARCSKWPLANFIKDLLKRSLVFIIILNQQTRWLEQFIKKPQVYFYDCSTYLYILFLKIFILLIKEVQLLTHKSYLPYLIRYLNREKNWKLGYLDSSRLDFGLVAKEFRRGN